MATRIDSSGWRRKKARLQKRRLNGRIDATKELGSEVARYIVNFGPHDTQRFRRSYAMAHNDIAEQRLLLPTLEPSKSLTKIASRIARQLKTAEAQVERWDRNVASYRARKTVSTPSGKEAQKYLRQWKKQRDQAKVQLERLEEAEGVESIILIGGRKRKRAGAGGPKSGVARVSVEVFGGGARIIDRGGRLFAELHSYEPHTNLVNRRTRVISNAVNAVRASGGRRASKKYLRELQEGGRAA